MKNYFTQLDNEEKSIVVHNGWVASSEDFSKKGGWHYLRRNIVVWTDSVKLYYGEKPSDSPYLWKRMEEYVCNMAKIFIGFRLDNAHSTPIHVCKYLLQKARSVNPNLFVLAELFTNSREKDCDFTKQLGINALIRESIHVYK